MKPAPPPARLYQPRILSGWFLPASCCSTTLRRTCSAVVFGCHLKRQYHSMPVPSIPQLGAALPGWLTDIPLRQADEQGQPQGGCPVSCAIYRHELVTAEVKLGADSGGSASARLGSPVRFPRGAPHRL